ncbi:MAG: FHA domain-containing protein [Anaerolineae bacterium]|nr:FHA domain-containing protein [Anaerolineae bacterium]
MIRAKRILQLLIACVLVGALLPAPTYAQAPSEIVINYPELADVDDALQLGLYFTITDSTQRVAPNADVQSARILLDDGEVADPALVEQPTTPFYIALVLDASGSMLNSAAAMRDAAIRAINNAPEEARFAIVSFNEQIQVLQAFTEDRNAAINAVGSVQPVNRSGTCLYDAAYLAVEELRDAPPGRRAIILFTDGQDEVLAGGPCSQHVYNDVVALATQRDSRVPIHTIGLSTQAERVNVNELRNMASQTGGLSAIGGEAELDSLFNDIMNALKSQWLAKGLFYPLAGTHTATLTVTLDDGTMLSAVVTFDVLRDYASPEPPTPTPTPIVVDLEILSVTTDVEQEIVYLEVLTQGEQIVDRYRFDFFDRQTSQLLDQHILPAPLPEPIAIPAGRLQGNIRVVLRALDRQGNIIEFPGERDDMIDHVTYEFAYLRPTPTPPPATYTPIPIEITLNSVSYDATSDVITLDLGLIGQAQMTTLEINVLDADTNLLISTYPNIRPEDAVSIKVTNLEPLKEYTVYVEVQTLSGPPKTSNRMSFVYSPPLTPTPTPTATPTLTPSPRPIEVGISGIVEDAATEEIVIQLFEVVDERIGSYELQLRNRDGLVIGEYVHIPPPFEIRVPIESLVPGEYTVVLRALGPNGEQLIETELGFAYNPPATPTPRPTATASPTITPTPQPGMVGRVTDTVRDNPALGGVVVVIAAFLLLLLFLLLRPRKKSQTGTDFLSAQTGFYQMPSGDVPDSPGGESAPPVAVPGPMMDEPLKTDVYPAALIPNATLQISRSPSMGRVGPDVPIYAVPFTIGRSVDDPNGLSLDEDTGISRTHAQITYEGNAFIITDLGSSNGTFVNDVKINAHTPVQLRDGTKIVLGRNTEIIFRADDDVNKTGYAEVDPEKTDYYGGYNGDV